MKIKINSKDITMALCAIFIPGGGIVAGLYYLNRIKKQKEQDEKNNNFNTPNEFDKSS